MENDGLEIQFNYPNHQIPAHVLAEYLSMLDLSIRKVSALDGVVLQLIVNATVPSSFKIKAFLKTLAESDVGKTIKYVSNTEQKRWIITSIAGVMVFFIATESWNNKQTIKSEDGENLIFQNGNNSPVTINKKIYNIIKSTNISDNLAKMGAIVQEEDSLESINIRYKDEQIITLSREDNKILSKISDKTVEFYEDNYIHLRRQEIKITKVDFEGKTQWRMILDGNPHAVSIDSDTLEDMRQIHINEKDAFIVDITILQKYDEKHKNYINKKFTIIQLHKHIPFEEPKLPFKNEI